MAARVTYALLMLFAVGSASSALGHSLPPASPAEMLEDAELRDICFVDPDRGFAVGDRGVIWRTDDGGRRWQLVTSPATCRLESIGFVDGQNGWIVGGWYRPYTHESHGVVLRTRDGGRSWQLEPTPTLPALREAKFFDVRRGWALGDPSPMYPTGVFWTEDGGRSWTTVRAGSGQAWLCGDFVSVERGVVAGRNGEMAIARPAELRPTSLNTRGLRHLHELRMTSPMAGWLVGDGGLVMVTGNGGESWQLPPGNLPPAARQHFDFQTLAVVDDHCWIAGSPGTLIFHSPDGGKSWETYHTGQSLPIRSLTFLDRSRGWAVGALGTILVTRDGGRTWQQQRSGGTRTALLGLFASPDRLPLEVFSHLCGNEGYLGAVEILFRRDLDTSRSEHQSLDARSQQAAVELGVSSASSAWQFPLRQSGLQMSAEQILADWNRHTDGQGTEALEGYLVRQIRTWRPHVILTEVAARPSEDAAGAMVSQLVLQAAQKAADPTAYPEQLSLAGLQPCTSVKKVFCRSHSDDGATVRVPTTQLATRLARSLADHAATSYALIRHDYQPAPEAIGFQLLLNQLPRETGQRDFFSGLTLHPGSEARRRLSPSPAGDLQWLSRMAQRRRNIQQLVTRQQKASAATAHWLGEVEDLTQGLPPSSAGEVLYQLAQSYERLGRSELAADCYQLLVTRYPDQACTEAAAVWLLRYYGSHEWAWRLRSATSFQVVTAGAPFSAQADLPGAKSSVAAASHQTEAFVAPLEMNRVAKTAGVNLEPEQRVKNALQIAEMLQATRPTLFADPRVKVSLANAYRTHGLPREAERLYREIASSSPGPGWRACAEGELWLQHGAGQAPKRVYNLAPASGRPHLDGQLDDPVWQSAQVAQLQSPHHEDSTWPAVVLMTYDEEFLYVAITCTKSASFTYQPNDAPRPRDADLRDQDRVELLLDLDRDYASYYRLTVDHRGWTAESCDGDLSWDPTWYVAAQQDSEHWTAELAIRLQDLAPTPPTARNAWAVGLQRAVPNTGFQAWTQPAAIEPQPQGFGLVIFQ